MIPPQDELNFLTSSNHIGTLRYSNMLLRYSNMLLRYSNMLLRYSNMLFIKI